MTTETKCGVRIVEGLDDDHPVVCEWPEGHAGEGHSAIEALRVRIRVQMECIQGQAKMMDDLRAALRACAVHEVNDDTCGVCGLHFAECEADERCVGDEVDEHDIPTGREPACPGARARALLAIST